MIEIIFSVYSLKETASIRFSIRIRVLIYLVLQVYVRFRSVDYLLLLWYILFKIDFARFSWYFRELNQQKCSFLFYSNASHAFFRLGRISPSNDTFYVPIFFYSSLVFITYYILCNLFWNIIYLYNFFEDVL